MEIIVIDNGSTDESPMVGRAAGALVLHAPVGRVSALRNLGASSAEGRILAFVDADHEIAPGWAAAAVKVLSMPMVAAAGAPYSVPTGATWVQRIYDSFRDHRGGLRDVEWLGSGNLVVTREAFAKIGGFDTNLEACEDVDLCQRLRAAGYRLVADPRLQSTHHGDPATLAQLFLSELWRGRDNLRVTLRGPRTPLAFISLAIPLVDLACVGVVIVSVIAGQRRAALLAASAFVLLASLRAARLFRRLPERTPRDLVRVWMVAAVYDAARALALAIRTPHRRRRPAASRAAAPQP